MKMILFLLLFSCSYSAQAQDPSYGDEFIKWVRKNARSFSEQLTESDYNTRLLNLNIVHYQSATTNSEFIGLSLDSLQKCVIQQEAKLADKANAGTDSIRIALQRSIESQNALNALAEVLVRIEDQDNSQTKFDSLSTYEMFVAHGLYHVGKENVLESIVDLSNSLSKNLKSDYKVGISFTQGEGGAASGSTSSGSPGTSTRNEVLNYVSLAATYAAYYVHPAFLAIPFLIGSNEIVRYYQKVEEQNKQVYRALELFDRITPSSEEMYKLYENRYLAHKNDFTPIRLQLDTLSIKLKDTWKSLYKFNVYRLESAKQILTKEKIRQLEEEYLTRSATSRLFNVLLVNSLNLDLNKQYEEIVTLEQRYSNERVGENKRLAQEDYLDALFEADAWYKELKSSMAFIPLYNKLEVLQKSVQNKVKVAALPYISITDTSTEKAENTFQHLRSSDESLVDIKTGYLKSLEGFTEDDYQYPRFNVFVEQEFVIDYLKPRNDKPYIGYNGINYELSVSNNGSFNNRYSITGDFIQSIISGSPDGGYGVDRRSASGIDQLRKASANLNIRIESLKADYKALLAVKDSWKEATAQFNGSVVKSINGTFESVGLNFAKFQNNHRQAVAAINNEMQTFLSSQINGRALDDFLKLTGIYAAADRNISPNRLRVTSAPILGRRIGSSFFPASNTTLQNEVVREGLKSDVAFADVGARIERNIATGVKDPVFSSIDKYEEVKLLVDNALRYAKYFADSKNEIVSRLPMSSATISNGYLHQVKLQRFYAQGLISEPEFKDYSIPDRELLGEELKKLVVDFEKSCNAGTAGDVLTPCNRFVGMALKGIYNVDDFIGIGTGILNIPLANEIYKKVKENPHWHLIGPASNQEANYSAALLAAEGKPVIAIQPNNEGGSGHVVVVMPGVPRFGTSNPGFGGVLLPFVSSWFKGRPELTFYNGRLSQAFGNGTGVVYFYRDLPK